jgi:exodeoxyribonuclease V alpha subunit
LPPVGAGLFFHRLVATEGIPRSELTRIFRQSDTSGIPAVARQVRDGVLPKLPLWNPGLTEGVQMQPTSTANAIPEAVRIRDALAKNDNVQVLTVFRQALGAGAVNRVLHARVSPAASHLVGYPLTVAVGEPVIYTRNDPDLDLQNGSVGVVLAADSSTPSVLVRWDDEGERKLTGIALLYCELAHGITVHKSQGSQYDRVIVVVPRASPILDRALLYTAITRAKTQAVLVGDVDAVRVAVQSPSKAHQRECLFLSS